MLFRSPFINELKVDQSISHNGVCLTVENISEEWYEVVAIQETLIRSNLGSLKTGDTINLERCLKLDGRLDGHMVQGHVDETTSCIQVENKEGSWLFSFQLSKASSDLIVEKGSVSINGVSLTVAEAGKSHFTVAIIPYTFENTTFHSMQKGTMVNIEYDIIGKYVKRMLENRK